MLNNCRTPKACLHLDPDVFSILLCNPCVVLLLSQWAATHVCLAKDDRYISHSDIRAISWLQWNKPAFRQIISPHYWRWSALGMVVIALWKDISIESNWLSTIVLFANSFDNRFISLTNFLRKSSQNTYFLVSLLLFGSKLNIFGLWTKQDIWGCTLVLWPTFLSPFSDILETKQLID